MRHIILSGLTFGFASLAYGQSAIDAMRFAQPDLKGTARYMSMAGAFGALGGDLSAISQNPAGIGVYRSNDLGFTLDLDCQNVKASAQGFAQTVNQTKFLLNNFGAVATLKFNSESVPNLNFGFVYNRSVSFNRKYSGRIPRLSDSMTNYIAGIANNDGLGIGDVETTPYFDPYYDGSAPWLAILGYDSYLIDPVGDPESPEWYGQWEKGTTGKGAFSMLEHGSVQDYNISIGGNISNKLFWGMDFDIVGLEYQLDSDWGEMLNDAVVTDNDGNTYIADNRWSLHNYYRVTGTGFNYKIGLIYKPIQEFRIGFSFHTPTWYSLEESYNATIGYSEPVDNYQFATTNGGFNGYNSMNFRNPMKLIGSAAGVLLNRLIISVDYEWTPYHKMKFSASDGSTDWYDDPWDWPYDMSTRGVYVEQDPFRYTNKDIRDYYRSTNTLRLGAEFRVTPRFSMRAGYSFADSPVKESARNDKLTIYTAGTMPSYTFRDNTQYVSFGLGYRWNKSYIDIAYVYKHVKETYHAYTPDPMSPDIPSPKANLTLANNQIVLSCGLRF